MNSISRIQGRQHLDVTVVACEELRHSDHFWPHDPYVCLEYAKSKFYTHICTDGGKNPTFQEKFSIPLNESSRKLDITVWNSYALNPHDFIGTGIVQLHKVLSEGYDDSFWQIETQRRCRYAGKVRLVMHFPSASENQEPPPMSYGPQPPHARPPPHVAYSNVRRYPYGRYSMWTASWPLYYLPQGPYPGVSPPY